MPRTSWAMPSITMMTPTAPTSSRPYGVLEDAARLPAWRRWTVPASAPITIRTAVTHSAP